MNKSAKFVKKMLQLNCSFFFKKDPKTFMHLRKIKMVTLVVKIINNFVNNGKISSYPPVKLKMLTCNLHNRQRNFSTQFQIVKGFDA